ncbi:NAD(P)/FAD-dependent oxidoreductase [Candidatus Thorarchaeota archaeon]|nr:MAG: NAD(P)/FAD-dependent oxidoreductase [Candidatus Thorarchaeota archaeon]
MMHDVAVVGAGPSGLLAAAEATRHDFDVVVFEEHGKVGVPDHCAGLLSVSGLDSLGLQPPNSVVQNAIVGAKIYSPSGHSLLIEREKREALVVNRSLFDQWLADRAEKKGVQIKTDAHVNKIVTDGQKYTLTLKSVGESIQSRFVCLAEGSRCQISQQLGFPSVPKSSKYPAYQFEIEGADIDPRHVEMFYGRKISTGFFAWVIPFGEGKARVGLASRDESKRRLKSSMKNHPVISERVEGAKIRRGLGGIVLVGKPIERTSIGNAVVTGDAAGHVKATTGGGVILGGVAARIAGQVIRKRLLKDEFEQGLDEYSAQWRAKLEREFRAMFIAQKFLTSLSDKGLDSLIHDVSEYRLLEVVEKSGDMDKQKRVLLELAKNPMAYIAGLKAIRYLSPLI